ncbi:MAG: glycosyltransferase family 2 protein, partial [Vulcanococcus sp.]
MQFSLVVATGNAAPWIGRCIQSIAEQQTRWQWQCLIIDDASDDGTEAAIQAALSSIHESEIRGRFRVQRNGSKRGALANLLDGFNTLGTIKRPMDVLIPIDGDDWLFKSSSLETVAQTYESTDCWLTYGGLITSPGGELCSSPVSESVIATAQHRQSPWKTSHLRSFRSHLWHAIRDEDLRDQNGDYYRVTWDMAIMFPMVEMAAERIQCVDTAIYAYNTGNPQSDHIEKRSEQLAVEIEIRQKPAYARRIQACPPTEQETAQDMLGFIVISDANPGQTIRLAQSLNTFYRDPLIHCIHNRSAGSLRVPSAEERSRFQPTEHHFQRGHFSQVEALLQGLQASLEQWRSTEWFAVISHESHPLISINALLSTLQATPLDGFLHAEAIIPGEFQSQWQATCWQRYGNEEGAHPFHQDFICHAGSPWMLLRRRAVETLLQVHQQQPWLADHYRWQGVHVANPAPEESYIHTALCNQKHLQLRRQPICWEDWGTGWPRILQKEDWVQLHTSERWFAQRFQDPTSSGLIAKIHDHWMLEPQ